MFTAVLLAFLSALQLDASELEQRFPQETVQIEAEEGTLAREMEGLLGEQQAVLQEASAAYEAGREREAPLSAARGDSGIMAVGTASHLLMLPPDSEALAQLGRAKLAPVYPADDRYSWAPRNVRALVVDTEGRLWFGCDQGAGYWDGKAWTLFTGKEGLPYTHFTCAAAGRDGSVWFGTKRGVVGYANGEWLYRAGKRFLPNDEVTGIAVDEAGTVWVKTAGGVSKIARTVRTLEEKAAEFERIVDTRHKRLGQYVIRTYFEEPGNLETAYQRATDNDGLYTAMYGAAQSWRYAATKDPVAKERAVAAFRAMKLLFDVTGIPGFPARAVIPTDSGEEDPNIGYGEEMNLERQKEDPLWKNLVPRWPVSADGKYWWKADTSSDEICGHYYFYALYHDFVCETEAEKKEVKDLVHALTSHIVDNGFTLTDHDGKPTRWANWSPDYVSGLGGWADRGLNSMEVLSFLNVGLHLTGDQKFAEAARFLRDEHEYHINALRPRSMWPPSSIVPWDNNLAFLSFYGLIQYEQDPVLKQTYLMALDNGWTFCARQNDPFFNMVWLSLNPPPVTRIPEAQQQMERENALAEAVETLVRTPQLLIGWRMENSHRLDVYLDPALRRRMPYGWKITDGGALPIDERSHIRINSDHFNVDFGVEGDVEYEGTFFLLPYYMGLHYGLIK